MFNMKEPVALRTAKSVDQLCKFFSGLDAQCRATTLLEHVVETARRLETTKLGLGVILLAGGVLAWMLTSAPVATSMLYVLYVAPIMAGVTLVWRWLTRL